MAKKYKLIIVLIAILLTFFLAVFHVRDGREDTVIVEDVPVNVIYDNTQYIQYGIPSSVDVILEGDPGVLNLTDGANTINASVNLEEYTPGSYTTTITYDVPEGVTVINADEEYNFSYETLVTKDFPVSITYTNSQDLQSPIVINSAVLQSSYVTLTAGSEQIADIAKVVAPIDMSQIDTNQAEQTISTNVVALDASGYPVPLISEVAVNVVVQQSSTYVELPVNFEIYNQAIKGKYVSSVTGPVTTVQVYGDKDAISQMYDVTYTVDVSNVKNNTTVNAQASLPEGVYLKDYTVMPVEVTLENGSTTSLTNQPIIYSNLDPGLEVVGIDEKNGTVDVDVTAAESEINNIDEYNNTFYVDLSGITAPGEYTVPVQVKSDMYATFKLSKDYITIDVQYK